MLLREILTHNATTEPTRAPLYRYKLAAGHRERLREALIVHCAQSVVLDGQAAAMFCLYAADQFRHHTGAGVWTWATVTGPIGWKGTYTELTLGVERGTRWWGRRVFATASGRRFLSTLVTEGGGPLGLLRDAHAATPLRGFLRRLLADRERFQRPAEDLVDVHRAMLSASLQHETALEVFAALVDSVAALRVKLREHGAVGQSDPVATLDRCDPGWRDRMVIDLDDGTARVLLDGLLREPSPTTTAARTVPCRRRMISDEI